MKTGKRVLSIFLVVLLLLTAAPLAGFVGLEIAPKAEAYEVGDHIQFGTYPQTRVDGTPELQAAANAAVWKSYDYYTGTGSWADGKMQPGNYMQFADFFVDKEKYRAVTLSSYRPIYTGYEANANGNYSNQDEFGYTLDLIYFFKYEPLEWRVLDPESGLVLSETIIDSQAYNNFIMESGKDDYGSTAYWGNIEKSYYANNYSKSYIRKWLNNDFYYTAFNISQQNKIKLETLDNSAGATYSAYGSESTSDKVFLLSASEATSPTYGFSEALGVSGGRKANTSDYAKCQGGRPCWRLRSALSYGTSYVRYVDINGDLTYFYYEVSRVNSTSVGVRPACKISNLISDISQSPNLFSESASASVGEVHAITFNPQSTTGIYQFSGILEDYVTTVVLNDSNVYIDNVTIDGKKYNIKKDVLSTDTAEQLKGKSVICNYDKNAEEIIAISKCREFSDLDQTDISNINKENRISVIIANEYKWLNGKVYVAGGTKEADAIPFKIEIGNSLPSNYFDLSDSCKKNSAFDITISDVKLTGLENCGQIFLNDSSFPKTVKLGESLYLEGSIYFPSDFWLGYEDSEKTITAEYEIQMNIGKDQKVFQTVVKNRDAKPVTQNESDLLTDAVNKLKKTSAISLIGLKELGFTDKQIKYLEKAVLVELSL